MELRGQDNKEMGIPGSMVYNPPLRELSSSSSKLLSSGNGALTLNQSQPLDHHDPNPDPVSISIAGGSNSRTIIVRYRECLKNHAASIGGHVIDGCGEFMPNGEEGTPEALKCAACECHRNFHRKDVDGEPQSVISNRNPHHNHHHHPQLPPPHLPPQHQKFPLGFHSSPKGTNTVQPMMMAFGGGGGTESSSEDLNVLRSDDRGVRAGGSLMGGVSKKRFRTKFTQEQKEKMLEFAERVGWRTQKQDEPAVQEFCADVGVRRQVLKVWMHNNKHILKKKPL